MRYFKQISDGYILAVGTGAGGTEITETEYNQILAVIRTKPAASGTTDYRLKEDLTWEPYTIEYVPAAEFEAAAATMLAATEDAMTATRNYSIGDLLAVGGVLYAVTAAIPSGGAITEGVNVAATTVAEQLAASGGGSVTVDSALSSSSTNPVQNKVVKAALDGKGAAASIPAAGSVSAAGMLSFTNSAGSQLFTVQLPLYAGGVS